MLKSITFAIASISIVVAANCARADIGNNSRQSKPDSLLYAQATTAFKKPLVYKSKLRSQLFTPQKSNLKQSAHKDSQAKSKELADRERAQQMEICNRLMRNNNSISFSTNFTIDKGRIIASCTIGDRSNPTIANPANTGFPPQERSTGFPNN